MSRRRARASQLLAGNQYAIHRICDGELEPIEDLSEAALPGERKPINCVATPQAESAALVRAFEARAA